MTSPMYVAYVVFLVIGALGSISFPVFYTIRTPWWHDEVGVHLFMFSALFALLYSRSVLGLFNGAVARGWNAASTGDQWFYLFVTVAAAFIVWQRFWIFLKSQRQPKEGG